MTSHLIDTDVKVATCNRCGDYVFTCQSSGLRVAADLTPLDVEAVRAALRDRRALYDQVDQSGRPWRLQRRTALSSWPPFAGRKVLGEHACGAKGMDSTSVTEIPPKRSGASSTARQATVPVGVPRRSDGGVWRCFVCKFMIKPGELYWGIEYGLFRWARHDRKCK